MQREDLVVVAYHEAGHAVMAMSCGYAVSKISIRPGESGKGHVVYHSQNEQSDDHHRRSVLICVSGMVADSIHWKLWGKGTALDEPHGWIGDQTNAREHLRHLNEGEFLDAYIIWSKRFLEKENVWEIVDALANIILKTGAIDGYPFLENIAARCPKFDDNEWEELEATKRLIAQGIE